MADHIPDPTEPTDPQDRVNAALVSAVNDAFDTDPISAELTQFAFDAFSWRVIDDELAAITFDSATTDLVGIRGTSTQRHTVQFEGRGVSISVVLSDSSLVTSIDPAGIHRCLVEGPHGATESFTDEDGEFVIDRPRLPLRVVVETDAGRVVSPWITA
ncbi:MAG: hypothetical protein ABIR32_19630 [Ilumatobacteraceae bacterium]